jgi:ATP-dependent DNA helicase RecQ
MPHVTVSDGVSGIDSDLFQRLRVLRKRLADDARVPAYIVFSDATLRAMAGLRPTSHGELLGVPGVGPAKVERYGDAFLEEIGRRIDGGIGASTD